MSDPLPGVSVKQAAIRFGTSESDIRRRIRRGELRAESIPRPGGTLLRVLLDGPEAAPDTRQNAPEPLQDAPAATMRLLDKLDERDATIRELHVDLLAATERAVRAETERDAARETAEAARAEADELSSRLARRRWWWPWST